MAMRLYTFAISHFAEKARWALDHKGIDYVERVLLPGSHFLVVRRMAPDTTVPVLRDGATVIQGSSQIIDYVDAKWPKRPLTPERPENRTSAVELERWLDVEFGTTLRRVMYFHVLSDRKLVTGLFTQRGPWWGPAFYRAMFPVVRLGIRRMYAIEPESAARDRERIDAGLARIDQLLDGQRYLVGDGFSRADLTLAALAAPLVGPPEHSMQWPSSDSYPPEVASLRERFIRSRAHEHVLRVYREHRAGPTPRN
jgi:glutathione S-transferase